MTGEGGLLTAAFAGSVAVLLAASTLAWAEVLHRLRRRVPLLPLEPRKPVAWTAAAVVGGAALYVLLPSLAASLVIVGHRDASTAADRPDPAAATVAGGPRTDRQATPAESAASSPAGGVAELPPVVQLRMIVVGSLASLAAAALVVAGLRGTASSARDLGWDAARLAGDLRLGLAAFTLLAPPVYAVQLVLVQWFPSRHPLVEILDGRPSLAWLIAGGLVAAVAAPLVEEFFFRVLLQGFLEAWGSEPRRATAAPAGDASAEQDLAAGFTETEGSSPPRWPIFASAGLFASVHIGHGPDPVPLFLLAVGLGYLYRQTHRIVPSVVVHGLLNTFSLAAFAVGQEW